MSLGDKLASARRRKGWTQEALAEKIGVSAEAVSKWEQDKYVPGPEKLDRLTELLDLLLYDDEGEPSNLRLYNEEHMSSFLKGKLNAGTFPQALKAMSFAKEKHAGQYRKPKAAMIPYINHPLTMACHVFALGLEEDTLLAAVLLHDVSEDCGVDPGDLPVSEEAREIVRLVTKPEDRTNWSERGYYKAIAANPKACIVKCIDRCNNLSSMSLGFSDARIAQYVKETETYYPELLRVIKECPEYNNAAWLLGYQMRGLLAMAKRIK